jgi:endonuclease/exonuclease/phosphatase family metal-dependent hydrolase
MTRAHPIRIMTYNVRYFGHALRGLASTRASKLGIAAQIAAMKPRPDVICLQEIETISVRSRLAFRRTHPAHTQLDSFMELLHAACDAVRDPCRYEAYYFRAHAYGPSSSPIYTTGLALLVDVTRLEVAGHNAESPHHITHHHVVRWKDAKQSRICAHMRIKDDAGHPLHVFNTHLSLPTPFAKEFWRVKDKLGHGQNQVREAFTLATFVQTHAGDEPFVLCGDFNAPPFSPVFHALAESGFRSAQQVLNQLVDGDPRHFPTAGFMRLRMHLDHLFSSSRVSWLDLDGTHRFGDRNGPFHGLSDHVPLIGRFRVRD